MKIKFYVGLALAFLTMFLSTKTALAAPTPCDSTPTTVVPGQCGRDGTVTGKYTSLYAEDASGNWYWDLGDGRILGTVASVSQLDQTTLTVCNYQNKYRGNFGGDAFLNDGWIMNNINCRGYADNSSYLYLIVHESDSRYTGNPEWAIWGNWEYKVLAGTGFGNLVQPQHAVGLE